MSSSYTDRAVTVFSSEGDLLQVQYASEAVRKGSPCVGVRGADSVVLASEKKPLPCLYEGRTEKKLVPIDRHVVMTYAGLRADARVLINRAQIECRCYRLSVEDYVSVEYISRYIATLKQLYTQSNGRRPFGVSCLIGGVDTNGTLKLFQTEPSGTFYEWKANSIGRNDVEIRAYLEKNYNTECVSTEQGAINLALRALLECQPPQSSNSFEVAIVRHRQPVSLLDPRDVTALVSHLQKQKRTADKSSV